MVKIDVKTPNKRKSLANNTPAKKVKVENGNGTPAINKTEHQSPKVKHMTPKKEGQSPKGTPKVFNKNKKQAPSGEEPSKKKIQPFAGTKPQKPSNKNAQEPKKKRKNQYSNLIEAAKAKEGTKDAETLKQLNEKIALIMARGELTKTAKRKLAVLNKLKVICEEGQEAAAAKSRAKVEAEKALQGKKTDKKVAVPASPAAAKPKPKAAAAAKKVAKKQPVVEEDDDDDDEEDDDDNDEVEQDDDDDDEEDDDQEDDEDDDEEDEDDDDDEEDDSEEEAPAPPPKEKPPSAKQPKPDQSNHPKQKQPSLDQLKTTDIVKRDQKRFVLFVGNIPFDTTKQEIAEHFSKVGDIVDIRIPSEKGSNRPRGFAYIEVNNETAYERCLSMHHSQMKGRRLNVLYTQGGKKKGDDKKKEIKAKNMKLHALRNQGKLAGSVKFSQKRSFRRNKAKNSQQQGDGEN
ncbi:unnamed protein product [Ceutorhynchus assimilis]|uniref:RRM domain-containing protein n=1 Tax=Ceutorhynchus assimilis TaxID=467358 RepID=A0A9N9QIB1_9CUCU|nr:unnamed protein product [Ceutorhynchus assimilis]